jgi:hypothetical protein
MVQYSWQHRLGNLFITFYLVSSVEGVRLLAHYPPFAPVVGAGYFVAHSSFLKEVPSIVLTLDIHGKGDYLIRLWTS